MTKTSPRGRPSGKTGRLLLGGGLLLLLGLLLFAASVGPEPDVKSPAAPRGDSVLGGPTASATSAEAERKKQAQAEPPITTRDTPRSVVLLDAGASPMAPEVEDAGPRVFRSDLHRCSALRLCGPDAVCQRTHGPVGCFRSNCEGPWDTHSCGGDFNACRRVQWGGNTIHRCMPGGTVTRGGTCSTFRYAAEDARCQPGLECVAGYCAGPCQGDACRPGERCVRIEGEAVCLPASSGCANGSECASGFCLDGLCIERGTLLNGTKSCVPGDCGSDAQCAGEVDGHEARGVCRPACGDDRPCLAGFACVSGGRLAGDQRACAKTCRSGRDCPRTDACRFVPGGEGLCEPAPPQDMSGSSQAIDEEVWATPDFLPAAN